MLLRLIRFFNTSPQVEPVAKRLVLDEMRNVLSSQLDCADHLDDKLQQVLESASLILSIGVALQAALGLARITPQYLVGLVAALVSYAALVIVTTHGMSPQRYDHPIPPKWDDIALHYFGEPEDKALSTLISTYLDCLDKNDAPIALKSRCLRISAWLLVMIVVALLAAGLIAAI